MSVHLIRGGTIAVIPADDGFDVHVWLDDMRVSTWVRGSEVRARRHGLARAYQAAERLLGGRE